MNLVTRFRNWLAGGLALLIVVLLVSFRGDSYEDVPMLDGSTITVVPGIHLLGDLGPAAAYVVETSEGLVLIDAGLDSDARQLKSQISKLKLDVKRLRAIFLTHVHGDHCGGAELLRSETGATIYAGKSDTQILRVGAPYEAFFSTFKMPNHSPHPTTVDVALEGDEVISFGDFRVRVLDTPGHTLGSTCYLMERGGRRVLFSGDVIMRLAEKPLGTYSAYLPPRYRGDARSYLVSLQKLRALPAPDLVLPGHPRSNSKPRSPRLTQAQWEEMLDDGIGDMQQLVKRFETDGANFLDGEPKRLLPDLYYFGDFQESAVYGFFADSKFFVVDAPGGPGLADFLKTRQRELGLTPAEPTAILLTACGDKETAGLSELVERSHAIVVVSPQGVDAVKQICATGTTVLSADEVPERNWFSVTPIPLEGRGLAPIVYVLRWGEKTVLFSGRIPAGQSQKSRDELLSDLGASKENPIGFLASIRRLNNLRPHLWLPAAPADGQNANLYDGVWKNVLDQNLRTAYQSRAR